LDRDKVVITYMGKTPTESRAFFCS
jgi:hypothetical protein